MLSIDAKMFLGSIIIGRELTAKEIFRKAAMLLFTMLHTYIIHADAAHFPNLS